MYMTEANKKALPKITEWLLTLPDYLCISFWGDNEIELGIQAHTQEQVAFIRSRLVWAAWKKEFNQELGWWEYRARFDRLGCNVRIYGVAEAPPTCRVERRTIEVEEDVPVTFEKRMVKKEVVEVHCGE